MMVIDSNNNFLENINRGFEEKAIARHAREKNMGYVPIELEEISFEALNVISKADAEKYQILPFYKNGRHVRVAVVDPDDDNTKIFIENIQKTYEVTSYLCSKTGFLKRIKEYDSVLLQKKKQEKRAIVTGDKNVLGSDFAKNIERFAESRDKIQTLQSQQALNEIKTMALHIGASDIHLQPFEHYMNLRLRIDGLLYDIFRIDREQAEKIVLRIKYESGMKSNIKDVPQDGHLDYSYEGRDIHFRVSVIPTPFFESVVIRVLDSNKGVSTLENLGFDSFLEKKIQHEIQRSQGLILVTGPTGSGKTTSLYAILKQLNSPEKKLVTLEDPIEYRLSGVSQSQINPAENYTFEEGFQAMLRHDPDIMLVGEIRNKKTAQLACEASMTGHLVLSSLHTNSAIETIARMKNLGIESFNLAPSLNLIVAQRLIRKIHPERIEMGVIPSENKRVQDALVRIKQVFPHQEIPEKIPFPKKGEDNVSAYEGRIAIAEVIEVDTRIKDMILNEKTTLEIEKTLRNETDFLSLFEYGILKVIQGETTLEEVYRVIG